MNYLVEQKQDIKIIFEMSLTKAFVITGSTALLLACFFLFRKSSRNRIKKPLPYNNPEFLTAIEDVKSLNPDQQTLLKLYGLYKRVLFGNPVEKRPWEPVARAKWDAWNSCAYLSQEHAAQTYVELVTSLAENKETHQDADKKLSFGPKVSKMVDFHDYQSPQKEYTIFDEIVDHFEMLPEYIRSNSHIIDLRDEENRTLLHWAVDQDNLEAVKVLIQSGADIDAKDAEGETPLAYSLSSDLEEVANFLLESGSNPKVASNFRAASEMTRNSKLKELLKELEKRL